MHIINSISEFHRLSSLPDPLHPLVSVVHVEDIRFSNDIVWERFFLNFYTVSLKKGMFGQRGNMGNTIMILTKAL